MNKLLLQSAEMGFLMGSVLALYVSLTSFGQMPHNWWLGFHNSLIILSLTLAALIGYKDSRTGHSFHFMLVTILVFFFVIMFFYIGSYTVTTAFFADQMVWIPFFYHDYNHHGFQSVAAYLEHNNNFQELLKLQIIAMLISSVMYFAAGSLGYAAGAIFNRMRKPSPAV